MSTPKTGYAPGNIALPTTIAAAAHPLQVEGWHRLTNDDGHAIGVSVLVEDGKAVRLWTWDGDYDAAELDTLLVDYGVASVAGRGDWSQVEDGVTLTLR